MILHLLRHFVGDAFNSISTLHVCPLLCSYCALPLSPSLGVTYDRHRINMLIPSSWCHIESRQSHRWAQRRQTARTTTPCSRSTCSTARGSSSPATCWSTGCFFNYSSQFSVPKWKTMGSQSEILFHEILDVQKILVGCKTFFVLALKFGRNS